MFVLKCKYKPHDKPFDIVYIENDGLQCGSNIYIFETKVIIYFCTWSSDEKTKPKAF